MLSCAQAQALALQANNVLVDKAVYLSMPSEDSMISRISSRWIDSTNGDVYNEKTKPYPAGTSVVKVSIRAVANASGLSASSSSGCLSRVASLI